MSSKRTMRDSLLFLGGITLGILGNIFVEYYMAWLHPEGIPKNIAGNGLVAMLLLLLIYMVIFVYLYTKYR